MREHGEGSREALGLPKRPGSPSALLRMVYNTMWVHVLVSVDFFLRKLVLSFHDVDLSDQTRTVKVRVLLLTKPSR